MSNVRKRSRHSAVCNFCKRRKVKCDKGSPCSACVRYGNPSCEYPPEASKRSSYYNESNGFGEMVMTVQQPVTRKKHRDSSASSASSQSQYSLKSSQTDDGLNGSMHSELEFLKKKISLLEQSVSLTQPQPSVPEPSAYPLWLNTNLDDLQFVMRNNPFVSDSQCFSFHTSYFPFHTIAFSSVRHYPPLHWISLIKTDIASSALFAMKHSKAHKQRCIQLKSSVQNPSGPTERVFNKKLSEFISEDTEYKESQEEADASKRELFKRINQKAKVVGLTVCEDDLATESSLVAKALLLLPTHKVIWLLIDRFFDRIYPIFPFLDQMEFEDQVAELLGTKYRRHQKVKKLFIERNTQVITLGLLLLVLRFSYLTLFSNNDAINESNLQNSDPSPEAQNLKFLLNNPIDIDVFELAQSCLNHDNYSRFPTLPVLQLCLYLRLYNSSAPETGEGADDSNCHGFGANVIDIAIALGLHREPNLFKSKVRDERANNLCRKIWWFLVIQDLGCGLTNGAPLSVRRSQFDTLPPYYEDGTSNIKNVEIEKQVIESLAIFDSIYDRIYKPIDVISDVKSPIPMKDLCANMNELEHIVLVLMNKMYDSYNEQVIPISDLQIVHGHTFKIAFQMMFFLISVDIHFFNQYERMGNIDFAYYYLKKVITIAVVNMMPMYQRFFEDTKQIYKTTTDIAITPSFLTLMHKTSIALYGVLLRSKWLLLNFESNDQHANELRSNAEYARRYELLGESIELCEVCIDIFVGTMKQLSSRYYYSWRYCKAQERLRALRVGTEFFSYWSKDKENAMPYSNAMIEDLNKLLRKAVEYARGRMGSELLPDLTSKSSEDDLELASSVSSVPEPQNVVRNDQVSDAMWMQMLLSKPEMANGLGHSQAAANNVWFDNALGNGIEEYTLSLSDAANGGFYESLFDDLMKQSNELWNPSLSN